MALHRKPNPGEAVIYDCPFSPEEKTEYVALFENGGILIMCRPEDYRVELHDKNCLHETENAVGCFKYPPTRSRIAIPIIWMFHDGPNPYLSFKEIA